MLEEKKASEAKLRHNFDQQKTLIDEQNAINQECRQEIENKDKALQENKSKISSLEAS